MKKLIVAIDIIIILLIIYQYAINRYPDIYREKIPANLEEAVEKGDMEYIERQFANDAKAWVTIDENEAVYRVGYVLDKLEENLPVEVVSAAYSDEERAYKVIYCEPDGTEHKTCYISFGVDQVNFFQVKITSLRVRF